ncbi:MAG TPA: hypothetical protein VK932_01310 [Kofleriaceae bacterium]|nr:hypothetical protein [Kofleriaceae bacterium]
MRSWLVLVALAAGCWTERAPAGTAPPPSIASLESPPEAWPGRRATPLPRREEDRCARAITHVFDLARRDAAGSGLTPAMLDDLQQAGIDACYETRWSDEVLDCYEGTTATTQSAECFRAMTEEQREDFERRYMDLRLRHRNTPGAPSTP